MISWQKPLVAGTDGLLILEPREGGYRKTNFPAAWRIMRLGMFVSFTSTGAENANPTAEVLTLAASPLNDYMFGFIQDPANPPFANASSKYVGVGCYTGWGMGIFLNASKWRFGRHDNQLFMPSTACIGSGLTITRAGTGNPVPPAFDPTATTLFAGFIGAIISVNSATGQLTVQVATASDLTDTSDANLNNLLINSTYSVALGPAAGGWWNLTTNPVDCPWIYVRSPFYNSRMRIHNIMAIQTL